MAALKRFFESNGGRAVTSRELIDFKNACVGGEYEAYVAAAEAELAKLGLAAKAA